MADFGEAFGEGLLNLSNMMINDSFEERAYARREAVQHEMWKERNAISNPQAIDLKDREIAGRKDAAKIVADAKVAGDTTKAAATLKAADKLAQSKLTQIDRKNRGTGGTTKLSAMQKKEFDIVAATLADARKRAAAVHAEAEAAGEWSDGRVERLRAANDDIADARMEQEVLLRPESATAPGTRSSPAKSDNQTVVDGIMSQGLINPRTAPAAPVSPAASQTTLPAPDITPVAPPVQESPKVAAPAEAPVDLTKARARRQTHPRRGDTVVNDGADAVDKVLALHKKHPDGIISIDGRGRKRTVTNLAKEILGYTRKNVGRDPRKEKYARDHIRILKAIIAAEKPLK